MGKKHNNKKLSQNLITNNTKCNTLLLNMNISQSGPFDLTQIIDYNSRKETLIGHVMHEIFECNNQQILHVVIPQIMKAYPLSKAGPLLSSDRLPPESVRNALQELSGLYHMSDLVFSICMIYGQYIESPWARSISCSEYINQSSPTSLCGGTAYTELYELLPSAADIEAALLLGANKFESTIEALFYTPLTIPRSSLRTDIYPHCLEPDIVYEVAKTFLVLDKYDTLNPSKPQGYCPITPWFYAVALYCHHNLGNLSAFRVLFDTLTFLDPNGINQSLQNNAGTSTIELTPFTFFITGGNNAALDRIPYGFRRVTLPTLNLPSSTHREKKSFLPQLPSLWPLQNSPIDEKYVLDSHILTLEYLIQYCNGDPDTYIWLVPLNPTYPASLTRSDGRKRKRNKAQSMLPSSPAHQILSAFEYCLNTHNLFAAAILKQHDAQGSSNIDIDPTKRQVVVLLENEESDENETPTSKRVFKEARIAKGCQREYNTIKKAKINDETN